MITNSRKMRKKRVRAKVAGTPERPRLSLFRSNKYIYAQLVDDSKMVTIASAKGKDSGKVGSEIAEKATKKKVGTAVFDRSGFKYHGRVQRLADAAREKGLKI